MPLAAPVTMAICFKVHGVGSVGSDQTKIEGTIPRSGVRCFQRGLANERRASRRPAFQWSVTVASGEFIVLALRFVVLRCG